MDDRHRLIAVVAVILFLFTWTLTTHGKYSASGDEPHYLIITHSIVVDRDLDLENNYARNDGRFFGHDGLERGLHAVPSRTGYVRSIHDIGLAVGLVPVYGAAQALARLPSESVLRRFRMDRGLFTYSIVSLFLIAVTAGSLGSLAGAFATMSSRRVAAAVTLLAGVSPPVVSHAFLVFPEVVALAATSLTVWFSIKAPRSQDASTLLLLLLFLGLLPWTHHKYALYAPGLVFVIAWQRAPLVRSLSASTRTWALILFAAPQVVLHAWTWHEWGTLAGALTTERIPFSWDSFWSGVIGLWFDRQSGLLAYAPIYWLLPACWWLTWKRTWGYAVPFMLLYLPAAAFVLGWWAGFAPAARYIAPAIPLLLVPVVQALRYKAVRVAALCLVVPQVVVDAVVWQHPRWLWPAPQGNLALQALGPLGTTYEHALPGIQSDGVTAVVSWALVAAVTITAAIVTAARREARENFQRV
jgi:hypothetical protein